MSPCISRPLRLGVLVAGAALLGAAVSVPTSADAVQVKELFYGRTNFHRAVSLELVNGMTPGPSRPTLQDRTFIMTRYDSQLPIPGRVRIGGRRVTWHRTVHEGPLSAEIWFTARRVAHGREIIGSYRKKLTLQSGRTYDEGTTRFSAWLWASSRGVRWRGRTADGRRLSMAVVDLRAPESRPRYRLRVPALPATLTCGVSTTAATIHNLTAPLVAAGGVRIAPVGGAYMFREGLRTPPGSPARGTAVASNGVTVNAKIAISRLAWHGQGLRAIGSLEFTGAEAGGGTCQPVETSFVLHPN